MTSRLKVLLGVAALSGCGTEMFHQAKDKPLDPSPFFADGRSARPRVEGTRAYDEAAAAPPPFSGPLPRERIARGRERFDAYCAPCHARTGEGDGILPRRGFFHPPSYFEPRLMEEPIASIYRTIGEGLGPMPPYAAQIPEADRWSIALYVKALQRSRRARLTDVPAGERRRLLVEQ